MFNFCQSIAQLAKECFIAGAGGFTVYESLEHINKLLYIDS